MICGIARFSVRILLLLGMVPSLLAQLPPATRKSWIEGSSAHFRFFSDSREATTRPVLRDFETFREVLRSMSPSVKDGSLILDPQVPTYVYLFSEESLFDSYRFRKEIAGYFSEHPDGNYVALLTRAEEAKQIAFHEYFHCFLHLNFPGVPQWLDEGMAEFYSTMLVEGNEVRLGQPDPGRYYMLQTFRILPMAQLAATTNIMAHGSGEEVQQFYASAWLTAHYLLAGNAQRRNQLYGYLGLIKGGMPADKAFPVAFGCPPSALDAEIQGYLNQINARRTIPIWRMDFKNLQVDPLFASKPMNLEQIQARLGLLILSMSEKNPRLPELHFRSALALNPLSAPANLGLGLLKLQGGHPAEGSEFFVTAADAAPDSGAIQYLAGESLFEKRMESGASKAAEGSSEWLPAKKYLRRALQLSPGHLEAAMKLAFAYSMENNGLEEGLPLLEATVKLRPGERALMFNLALLYLQMNETGRAQSLLQNVAQAPDAELARQARETLDRISDQKAAESMNAARELASKDKGPECILRLEEALGFARDPQLKVRIQRLLEEMKAPPVPASPTPPTKVRKTKK